MKKEYIYNDYKEKYKDKNDYIYKDEKIYDYSRENNYYKSYGRISRDNIRLAFSDEEVKELRKYLSLLTDRQYKVLNETVVNARNLGIRLSYQDLLFLTRQILSSSTSSISVGQKQTETEEEKKQRLERERLEREKRERERLERIRLERERLEKEKEERIKKIIDKFMSDIKNKQVNSSFRGWVLPNGLLMSQYNETTDAYMSGSPRRQDHSSLVKTFMAGLEEYDKDAYDRMQTLYSNYLSLNGVSGGDYDESFAVETLGWMQVSVCGSRVIAYRAERWQDRILRPFFMDYGFKYIVQDRGRSYEMEFAHLYDNMDEILELGLRKRYKRVLK